MHYADYNLFYNPDSPGLVDYSIPVEPDDVTPLTKGTDGFAKHDVHAAPGFAGPLPTAFPYASADVQAGTVKVSTILAHYRALYTPGSGSPLVLETRWAARTTTSAPSAKDRPSIRTINSGRSSPAPEAVRLR
jgi:hypothetical protein